MLPEIGERNWIHDACESGYIPSIDRLRAEGILSIHASCEPPCPRKRTARDFLNGTLFPSGG